MAPNLHSIPQIESMSVESVDARVEVQFAALLAPGRLHKPIEEDLPPTGRALTLIGDQIIDVEQPSPGECLEHSEARHASHRVGVEVDRDETVAALLLPTYPGDELFMHQGWPELGHCGEACFDLGVTLGNANLEGPRLWPIQRIFIHPDTV